MTWLEEQEMDNQQIALFFWFIIAPILTGIFISFLIAFS